MKLANFSNLPYKQHVPTFRTIANRHHAFPFVAPSNFCHVSTLSSQSGASRIRDHKRPPITYTVFGTP